MNLSLHVMKLSLQGCEIVVARVWNCRCTCWNCRCKGVKLSLHVLKLSLQGCEIVITRDEIVITRVEIVVARVWNCRCTWWNCRCKGVKLSMHVVKLSMHEYWLGVGSWEHNVAQRWHDVARRFFVMDCLMRLLLAKTQRRKGCFVLDLLLEWFLNT